MRISIVPVPVLRSIGVVCSAFLASCASTTPVHVSEHTVRSLPLHLTVSKPVNWEFVSHQDVRDAQRKIKTANQTLNYLVYQEGVRPFVTMTRAEKGKSEYPPTFTINREPLGENRFASNEKVAGFFAWGYLHVFKNAQVVGPNVPFQIGGQEFAHTSIKYSVPMAGQKSYEIQRHFWVRSSALSALVLSLSYDVRDGEAVEPELLQILKSLVLEDRR